MKLLTLAAALALVATSFASPVFAQAPAARAAQAQEPTGVDAVVALVSAGISEAFILKSIQNGGTAYNLTPSDLVRLKTAGASDRVIEAMLSPTTAPVAAAPVMAAPVAAPIAAPAVAAAPQQAPSRGSSFMRRLGDRLAATAEQTVDNAVNSAATAADNAAAKATGAVDKKLGAVTGTTTPKR